MMPSPRYAAPPHFLLVVAGSASAREVTALFADVEFDEPLVEVIEP